MAAWQPIETAPKDGTRIIGVHFDGYRDEQFLAVVWWQPEFDAWIESCRQMTMAPGYLIDGKTSTLHSPDIRRPTHWMRLPPAPEKKRD